jgi:hypothetical protein
MRQREEMDKKEAEEKAEKEAKEKAKREAEAETKGSTAEAEAEAQPEAEGDAADDTTPATAAAPQTTTEATEESKDDVPAPAASSAADATGPAAKPAVKTNRYVTERNRVRTPFLCGVRATAVTHIFSSFHFRRLQVPRYPSLHWQKRQGALFREGRYYYCHLPGPLRQGTARQPN